MPKISVIMPSLNVAKYIRECMDSVVSQSLEDIEILAVDAGSTDGTLEILREYEARDSRVKVILSEKKSYGHQMNLGLREATGTYIGIVETDDILMPDTYAQLVLQADAHHLDYIKGYAHKFFDLGNGNKYVRASGKIDSFMKQGNAVVCPSEIPELLKRDMYLWTGIYRRDFLCEIRFHETAGAAFQDQGVLLKTLSTAKCAMYIERPVYFYRHDNISASTYSLRALEYLSEEYSLNEGYLFEKASDWKGAFYYRLWLQTRRRIVLLAVFERMWETDVPIKAIREKLRCAFERGFLPPGLFAREDYLLFRLFIENPESVYAFYVEQFQPKLQNWKNIIAWAQGQSVIICGGGNWGKFAHAMLARNGNVSVAAFADSNPSLWGTGVQGVPVLSMEEAALRFADAKYLIANKNANEEMQGHLLRNGILADKIFRPRTLDTDLWLLSRTYV